MRRTITFLILVVIIVAAYFLIAQKYPFFGGRESEYYLVRIGTKNFKLEIADTEEKQIKGLSGRDSLPENQGMIFLFDKPASYGMVMDGMKFPLDFIWLRGKSAVDIRPNVHLDECLYSRPCYPQSEADTVIELNAGMVARTGVKIGDYLSW